MFMSKWNRVIKLLISLDSLKNLKTLRNLRNLKNGVMMNELGSGEYNSLSINVLLNLMFLTD